MSEKVVQLRERVPDSEKITINLGYVDLGRIDLLVQEGFFSNRTDFIRTAIRNQLNSQSEEVSRSIDRHTLEVGLLELGVAESRGGAGCRRNAARQGRRAGPHRLGRHAGTRAADDRLPDGARSSAGKPTDQGRPGRKDQIAARAAGKDKTMNNDYVAEILRATGSLRSGDPAGVTAIIQNALAAAGLTGSVGAGPSGNPNPGIQLPQTLCQALVTEPNFFRRGPIGCGNP